MRGESLFVVTYPEISVRDRAWLETFRQINDPNASKITAHFTLAFAVSGLPVESLCNHVASVSRREPSIEFTCRHVMVGHDHAKPLSYVFLVPDEGLSAVNLLRQRLHVGPLRDYLKPEIPYIPHITLGTAADAEQAQEHCSRLNNQMSPVHGVLTGLTLVKVTTDTVQDIETFPLLSTLG